jgi:hypothetical protein
MKKPLMACFSRLLKVARLSNDQEEQLFTPQATSPEMI